jgi:uncharacterized protein with gpF-like domain
MKRRLTAEQKKAERNIRAYDKALRKEFKRQGQELIKWLEETDAFARLERIQQNQYSDILENKRKNIFYEDINKVEPAELRVVGQYITGWQDKVVPGNVKEITTGFAKKAADIGGGSALKQLGVKVDFDLRNPRMLDAIDTRGEKITGGITKKTQDDFQRVMAQKFYVEGAGVPEVKKAITDMFEETYKNRARTIARTEMGRAQESASQATYVNNGVEQKRWIAFLDDVTREDHVDAHNQIRDINEPYDVGGESLMHPLDSGASPEQVINCRCVSIPEIQIPVKDEDAWTGE